jgi:hypothetical protein
MFKWFHNFSLFFKRKIIIVFNLKDVYIYMYIYRFKLVCYWAAFLFDNNIDASNLIDNQ